MGFMNRRKPKEQEQTDAQASESQIGQSLSKKSKKGKKNAPEPKFELDLSTALSCRAPLRIFHFAEVKNYEPNPNP